MALLPFNVPVLKPMKKRRHVLVALWWWDDRLLRGIATYAHEAGWILNAQDRHRFWDVRSRRVDGLITLATNRRLIQSFKAPAVDLSNVHEDFVCPKVIADDAAIGMAAAEHFIRRGIEDIGFVEFRGGTSPTENDRRDSLQIAVRKLGRRFHLLRRKSLHAQLRRLPKPTGLMAVNDDTMMDVMEYCLERGYQIPEQVALLGVDDVESVCQLAPVPLSSVNMDFERRGYQAARLLDRLMDRKSPPKKPVVVPIRGVTARRSTEVLAVSNPHVMAALRFIHEHYREPLKVRDVMKQIHISRQALQNHFRRHVGHSLLQEIMRLRMEEAKQLLRKTNLKIDVVAERSGFTDRLHFHRAFTKLTGLPPAAWRQHQQRW